MIVYIVTLIVSKGVFQKERLKFHIAWEWKDINVYIVVCCFKFKSSHESSWANLEQIKVRGSK